MDKILEMLESLWANSFVRALVFLVIGLVAAALAGFIVKKICKLFRLDSKLGKWGAEGGREGSALKFIGRLTFLIVFLLFLPAVLDALGLDSVSDPITDFASTFIRYLPNIIAALILVFLGVFIGEIVSTVVTSLLAKTKIDNLTDKLKKGKGSDPAESDTSEDDDGAVSSNASQGASISTIIGKILYALIVLIAVVEALTVLDISVISDPALEIIATVFGVIPELALAVIVFWIGLFLSGIVADLLKNIMSGLKLDSMAEKAVPVLKNKLSPTNIISQAVRAVIILFVAAEAIKILGFTVLSEISAEIISYLPLVIKAMLIALLAFIGAGLTDKALSKIKPIGVVVRTLIYTVAAFMILSQLEFASTIVNYAFIISLCALALAFAIAFGIGGRDFAKKTLGKINLPPESDKTDGNNKNN